MVRGWRKFIGASIASLGSLMVGMRSGETPDLSTAEEGTLVEFVSSVPAYTAVGIAAVPSMGTLWRSSRNVIRLTFSGDLPSTPLPGQILIQELLPGSQRGCSGSGPPYGPDLSPDFIFTVEDGTVLRIRETSSSFGHRKWYAIRNIGGWLGVADFEAHFPVQVGDASGDNRVLQADVLAISTGVPCLRNCGDQNRKDINGDGRVLQSDVGEANTRVSSLPSTKPCGH